MTSRTTFRTLALCLVLSSASLAQSVDASIQGRVLDASKAAVAGAELVLVEQATGLERRTRSGEAGGYSFAALQPGLYSLEARAKDFRSELRQGLTVAVGARLAQDFVLEVGPVSDAVTVAAEPPSLNQRSASVSTVIPNNYLVELPLDGRNFLELVALAAGVTKSADGSAGSTRGRFAFQAGGARESANSFVYDGVYAIDPVLNSFTFTPPVDAVQEFRVETANSEAGQGRNSGGQVSVSLKRGGNQFHGTAYHFLRNSALDARNFFDQPDQPTPKLRRNQFGGSIGGPLRKNSTFFFADYEGLRERRAITRTTNTPTAAERSGDFSSSSLPAPINFLSGQPFENGQLPAFFLHPVGQGVASLYPLPNRAGAGQNFVSAPTQSNDGNKFDVRVDQKLGENGRLAGRYSFADRTLFEPFAGQTFAAVPGYGNDVDERGQNLMASETHTFGSRWVNEVRFGFNRVDNRTFHENSGTSINRTVGLPDFVDRERDLGLTFIQVTGLSPLGDEFNNPQDGVIDSYQFSDTASVSAGNHFLQFGFEQRFIRGNAFRDVQSRGQISFTDFAFTQSAFADVLLGLPSFTGGAASDSVQNQRTAATNLFAQDSWRVRSGLTVTLGLRYEYNQPAYDAFDAAAVFDSASQQIVQVGTNGVPRAGYESDLNNFAPRIGIAWSPRAERKTVVRAGYGIHYNFSSLAPGQGIYFNPPFFNFQLFFPSQQQQILLHDPWPEGGAAPVPPSAVTYDRNLRTSYAQNWNFTIEQEFADSTVVSVGYVGTRGVNLLGGRDINQPAPSTAEFNLRPNPFYSDVNQIESAFDSVYHSLQAQLQCRFRGGLTGLFNYTWSKSIDNASNFFASAADPNFAQDSNNVSAERGRSSFDTPHRFVGSFAYELPFGKDKRWAGNLSGAAGALVSGWKINSIITLASGQPATVALPSELDNSNTGRSIFGFGAGDRPNLVGNPNRSNPDPAQWIDPAAFAFPAFGTFGNAGRNIVQGPPLQNVNFSAVKDTHLAEDVTLQFRAEFFNFLNTPNFGQPNIFFGTPGFGRILSARDGREVQFGVKLLF